MLRNFVISIALHGLFVVVAYVGLPAFETDDVQSNAPITVEIVTVSDKTNVPEAPTPKRKPIPEKKKAPPPPPKPPTPPPAPIAAPASEPEPVAEVAEEVEVAAIIPPKPIEKPKPKPVEVAKKSNPTPTPPRKPKPPQKKPVDTFQSVLKTLETLKKAPPPEKEEPKEEDFAKLMETALDKPRTRNDLGSSLTISEIDLVRQQIHKCWQLPGGAKDAHKMQISIGIVMNRDGRVRTANVLNSSRMGSDPFYRAMAESALRATLNPRCQPFKLPPEKYDSWQTMKLNFDPKDMFGL